MFVLNVIRSRILTLFISEVKQSPDIYSWRHTELKFGRLEDELYPSKNLWRVARDQERVARNKTRVAHNLICKKTRGAKS